MKKTRDMQNMHEPFIHPSQIQNQVIYVQTWLVNIHPKPNSTRFMLVRNMQTIPEPVMNPSQIRNQVIYVQTWSVDIHPTKPNSACTEYKKYT